MVVTPAMKFFIVRLQSMYICNTPTEGNDLGNISVFLDEITVVCRQFGCKLHSVAEPQNRVYIKTVVFGNVYSNFGLE